MRAVAYIRVSTDKQADGGVSLDEQRERCEAYCRLYGFDLVEVIADEGASAKTLDRPGLQRACAMLAAGEAEALVVAKLDRLTRSVRDLGTLIDDHFGPKGVALVSVGEQVDTSTATGRMILNVLMSVAQWEREAIGERTSAAMLHKRAQLEYTGGRVRYGYRVAEDGRSLEPVASEQAVIAAVGELHAAGLSLRSIAARLEARGFKSRTGRRFNPKCVRSLVDDAAEHAA